MKKAKKSTTKKTKTRPVAKDKTIKNRKPLFIFIGCFLLLMIISYFILGGLLTAFLGAGILVIVGLAKLLDSVRNKPKKRKIVNIILIAILSLGILIMVGGIAFIAYVVIEAPKFDVEQLNAKEPSILYDINNEEYAKLGSEMRDKITYDELPEVLIDAIVATEDSRFFQHNGFDAPRFLMASLGQLAGNSDAGGASTLSMQVIKNTFTTSEASGFKGIVRKFTDIYLAVFKLEKNYTKEQIIEFYVNNHNLGDNIYGVSQAAQVYFNKSVQDLNLSEAAVIAGMFKAPNLYKPTNSQNIEAVTNRRDTVLYLMERHGYITSEQREIASSISVESLVDYNSAASAGISEYQGYIDTVVAEIQDKYNVNPYVVPMLIYTNLDRSKQDGLNRVMNGESYQWVNDVIQSGVTVLDSETGKILAIGAGRNKTGVNELNLATSDDIKRQPGSTAKPLFDYGPLMEYNNASTYGYNDNGTYRLFVDEPYSYTNGPSINNWDGKFMGPMTIRSALSLSRNIPALKAFQQVDNEKIIEFVRNLGIEPEVHNGKIYESSSLGAMEGGVNSLQMAAAYAAFSNGGYYNEPYSVNRVVFRDSGEERKHEGESRQAMSDSTAFMITSILDDVTITGGGAMANVAMKTGTTNWPSETIEAYGMAGDAIRDSWVVGYTTKTVISMWYGYTDMSQEMVDQGLYCHNLSGTIQRDRLFTALANEIFESNKEEFKMPNSVVRLPIVAGSNPATIAGAGYTGSVIYEYFKKGAEPTNTQTVDTLEAPSNFTVSYSEDSDTVNLSWNAVNPGISDSSYGTFGYNVYFNDTLLGFTDKTSYTITNPSNPYGTYKIIATYKSYDGIQSSPATYELKKVSKTIRVLVNDIEGTSFRINDITKYVTVMENDTDVTSKTSNWTLISISNGTSNLPLTTTTLSDPGTYTLKYRFTYDGSQKETGNIEVIITGNSTPETPTDPSTES